MVRRVVGSSYQQAIGDDLNTSALTPSKGNVLPWEKLLTDLRERHGFFWRRKVRLLLVVGEPEQIEAIAPGLREQRWLEGQNTVLLWAGSVQGEPQDALLLQWRGLCRRRALNGVVWALSKDQCTDAVAMSAGARRLQSLARALRWQLPLHLWQVGDSAWSQDDRDSQPVGCLLPSRVTPLILESSLNSLLDPLRRAGLAQMHDAVTHDFLLRLSRDLQAEGIARWRQVLTPLLGAFSRGVPLRGLWFSLPVPPVESTLEHFWPVNTAWQGVLNDKAASGRRLGWSAHRITYALALGLAVLWGAGLLLSFVSNRAQIAQIHTSLAALQHSSQGDEQLQVLKDAPPRPTPEPRDHVGKRELDQWQTELDEQIKKITKHPIKPIPVAGLKVHVCSLVAPDSPAGKDWVPVYIHSKLMIINDVFTTHGSANINTRSMQVDSELNIAHEWMSVTQALRRRLWDLHTEKQGAQDDPAEAFKAWQYIISKNKDFQSQKLTPDAPLVEFYYGEATLKDLD